MKLYIYFLSRSLEQQAHTYTNTHHCAESVDCVGQNDCGLLSVHVCHVRILQPSVSPSQAIGRKSPWKSVN